MIKQTHRNFQLAYITRVINVRCYWCGQLLKPCKNCKGSGKCIGNNCTACAGNGWICPTHEQDWTEPQ